MKVRAALFVLLVAGVPSGALATCQTQIDLTRMMFTPGVPQPQLQQCAKDLLRATSGYVDHTADGKKCPDLSDAADTSWIDMPEKHFRACFNAQPNGSDSFAWYRAADGTRTHDVVLRDQERECRHARVCVRTETTVTVEPSK
jgi:hypothetical protein